MLEYDAVVAWRGGGWSLGGGAQERDLGATDHAAAFTSEGQKTFALVSVVAFT